MNRALKSLTALLIVSAEYIGKHAAAWDLFYRMANKGLKPAADITIHALCKEGQMEKANDLELEMEEDKGCTPNMCHL